MDASISHKVLTTSPREREGAPSSRIIIADIHYVAVIALAWSIPVGLTLLSASLQSVFPSAMFAAILSGVALVLKPKMALVVLPFFALLSPVAGFLEILDARLLLSDILFVLLAVQLLILFFQKQLALKSPYYFLLLATAVLLLASSLIGFITNTLISPKPLVYLLQLAIVYCYTASFAKDQKAWDLVINAWLAAAFLGSLLLINGFMTGQILENFKYGFDSQLGRETLSYLFRATYYYSGFHYVLGIGIVILFVRILTSGTKLARIVMVSLLGVFATGLIMMANRTAMFSTLIAIAGVLAISFYLQKQHRTKLVLAVVVLLSLICFLILGGLLQYMGENQADQWLARLSGGSEARWEVYDEALTVWFTYPVHILTGMGPDFLDGSGDTAISTAFKVSGVTGLTQGTVDSGWISYLIEGGVFTFLVLVVVFIRSIGSVLGFVRQTGHDRDQSAQSISLLGALLFITIALSTQMLGYTKLTWLPFQLLIIGLMHKNLIASHQRKMAEEFEPARARVLMSPEARLRWLQRNRTLPGSGPRA